MFHLGKMLPLLKSTMRNQNLKVRCFNLPADSSSVIVRLFSDPRDTAEGRRLSAYVEQRKLQFDLAMCNSMLDSYFSDHPELITERKVIDKLITNVSESQRYIKDGPLCFDKDYEIQKLGIARHWTGQYVVELDFSECLDLVLHNTFGCSLENIRKIPDYLRISKAILSYDNDRMAEICFSSLFGVDPKLDEYFAKKSFELEGQFTNIDDAVSELIIDFSNKVYNGVGAIRDYTVVRMRKGVKGQFIYKSKKTAAALCNADAIPPSQIVLLAQDQVSTVISPKVYTKLEAIEKGEYYAVSRNFNTK